MKKIVEEFIAFAEREYGVILTAIPSKDGEHFRDFYGYDFDEVLTSSVPYENRSVSYNLPSAEYKDDFALAA